MNKKEKNTLIIHIGTMKTGTTALQHFLYNNREELKNYGWIYPDFFEILPEFSEEVRNERTKNGIYLYDKDVRTGIKTNSKRWTEVWKNVLEQLEQYNVILSAEELYEIDILKVLREVKKLYGNIKVIVYLRRQDRYIESRWIQRIKGSTCGDTFNSFVKKIDCEDILMKKSLNYLLRLREIEEIIGQENIIVRVYEKKQFEGERGDVISDFFKTLNIDIDFSRMAEPTKANERFNNNLLEVKRMFNLLYEKEPMLRSDESIRYLWQLNKYFPCEQVETGYFSTKERIEFLQKYQEQNKEIAKTYLNRQNGILFYDEKMEYPKQLIQATPFEEDLLKVLSYFIFKQRETMQNEINKLNYQNKHLVYNFILMQKEDRKIAYFGAGNRCIEIIRNYQLPVEFIIDNDPNKRGKQIAGISVGLPSDIQDLKSYFILVTCMITDEIEVQLNSYGLHKNKDFILLKELM